MSGGHYPSYNHLQSPQEFLGPRHRLPTIPSTGPPASYTSASLSRAHAPNTSWMNKQSKNRLNPLSWLCSKIEIDGLLICNVLMNRRLPIELSR